MPCYTTALPSHFTGRIRKHHAEADAAAAAATIEIGVVAYKAALSYRNGHLHPWFLSLEPSAVYARVAEESYPETNLSEYPIYPFSC